MSSSVSMKRWLVSAGTGVTFLMSACAPLPPSPVPADEPAVEQTSAVGLRSLEQGVQLYQSARYDVAETLFKAALIQGLPSGPDAAKAHKYLAFIYCTSKRESLCAGAFRSAREADPAFELSKVESGHPLWGPVYRRTMATGSK